MSQNRELVDQIKVHEHLWDHYFHTGQQALRKKHCQQAERMLNMAYRHAQALSEADERQVQSARCMVQCYMERGDYATAQRYLNPLLRALFLQYDPNSEEVQNAMLLMAEIYAKQV